ncbi:MAG: MerR family transcriptional regulator [Clostridia bacterium]|nr:MerR family transcriptional regulator [Clostridia bacterium]
MRPIQRDELDFVASIDQVSKLLDIPKSTLRYYDRSGIIQSKRNENKDNSYRIYTRSDIVSLFDFMGYRNLDVSLKEIQSLNLLPIENRNRKLIELIRNNQSKMQKIMRANDELMSQLFIIQKYLLVKEQGYTITEEIEVDQINEFHILDPDHMKQWVNGPFSRTYTMLSDGSSPDVVYEGLSNTDSFDSPIIWRSSESTGRYLECLTHTEFASPHFIDMEKPLSWLRERDLTPGKIICMFFLPIVDEKTGVKYDAYHTWIELK